MAELPIHTSVSSDFHPAIIENRAAMSAVTDSSIRTLADLVDRLGGVPLERIRFQPPPGTATEQDVLEIRSHERKCCELEA
jgi:hypothetical protein